MVLRKVVLFAVIALHAGFVLIILISPNFVFQKKVHKPLIVKTISAKPATPKTAAVEKKPVTATPTSSPAPVAKPQPAPKSQPVAVVAPPPAKKTPPSKPAPAVKKEPAVADKTLSKKPAPAKKTPPPPPQNRAKISDALMRELEQSIANIDHKPTVQKPTKPPSLAPPIRLQIDTPSADIGTDDSHYTDHLVDHLRRALSLPEYGEVKIQLSLRQDGTVAKLIVLRTQSEKNKHYLESNLPQLKFPRFDGAYANKKEYTFILTFCNE